MELVSKELLLKERGLRGSYEKRRGSERTESPDCSNIGTGFFVLSYG
jgi:hypothetical protein